jgi:Na+-driven multidrug efflux pump
VLFFVDSTLFSAILIIVGRHDVQGMAALALIFEWITLAVMVPVGLSEAIIQRVSALRASGGGFQILVMACMCLSGLYLAVLALIQFGFGINMPALFILEGEAHPALMLLLNDYVLMGFGVAIMYSHVIIVAGILRGLLDAMASMIAVVLCYWVVGIGLTLVFVEIMGLGSRHALIAVLLSAVLAALSISWQLSRSVRKFR